MGAETRHLLVCLVCIDFARVFHAHDKMLVLKRCYAYNHYPRCLPPTTAPSRLTPVNKVSVTMQPGSYNASILIKTEFWTSHRDPCVASLSDSFHTTFRAHRVFLMVTRIDWAQACNTAINRPVPEMRRAGNAANVISVRHSCCQAAAPRRVACSQ